MTDEQIAAIYRKTFPLGPHLITGDVYKFARALLQASAAPAHEPPVSFDAAWDSIDWDVWRMRPLRELVRHLYSLTTHATQPTPTE